MEKDFIPYEQAYELQQLDFNQDCFAYYDHYTKGVPLCMYGDNDGIGTHAPLYQQAFRWFREKYGLVVAPQYFTGGFYCFTINNMKDTSKSNRLFTEFETYEEAELACLKKLIEIVKPK